jgi:hypothetical protein
VSGAASYAVLEAASVFERQGRPNRAVRVLQRGLESLESGWHNDAGVRNELHGRMIRQLERSGRVREASEMLGALIEADPGVVLSEHGESIDAGTLLASLGEAVLSRFDRPDIGTTLVSTNDKAGWMIHHPEDPTGQMPSDSVFMLSTNNRLALWRVRENGLLRTAWGGIERESVLRVDRDSVYTLRLTGKPDRPGYRVVKREMSLGREVWVTPEIGALLEIEPPGEAAPKDRSEEMRRAVARTLMYVFDARTLVVVGLNGQAISFDLLSGRALWQQPRVMHSVSDIASGGGVLAIGGDSHPPDRLDAAGTVHALDVRTGESITSFQTDTRVQWVETGSSGSIVCGIAGGVMMLDPFREQVLWRHTFEDGIDAQPLLALPGRVLMKDLHNRLWLVSFDSPARRMRELDSRGKLVGARGLISAVDLGGSAMISSTKGIVLLTPEGEIVGVDVGDFSGDSVPAVAGQDVLVSLGADAEVEDPGVAVRRKSTGLFAMRLYTAGSCRLESTTLIELGLPRGGMSVALTDGKVLVTSGIITTVIDAPAVPEDLR